MAEAPLLFGIAAFLASLGSARRRPWLAGLAVSLAFNAKYSALALLPVGLMAVVWQAGSLGSSRGEEDSPDSPKKLGRRPAVQAAASAGCQYLAAFAVLTLALNPFLWRDPLGAIRASLSDRRDLLERQVSDFRSLAPGQVLDSYGERAAVLLAHLYLTPPLFSETGNYRQATAAAESAYLANPLHRLWRGPLQGGALLGLTLLGLTSVRWEFRKASVTCRRQVLFLLLAGGFQFAGLVLAVPLAWQRYSLPLLPFVCLWAGMGLEFVVRTAWIAVLQQSASRPGLVK
jgi:hypothetical protein